MELNELLTLEVDGATYGGRLTADGEIKYYRLNERGEWEELENADTIPQG